MAKRISEQGNALGKRTDRAGLCKAHKARLCELERNPRQQNIVAKYKKHEEKKDIIRLQR